MSAALVGALAAALAVVAAICALVWRGGTVPRGPFRHPDATALEEAGQVVSLERWEAIRLAIVGAVAVLCWALHAPLLFAAVAAIAPSAWIRLRAEAAHDRSRRALSRMLATTSSSLRSGLSLPEAIRRAADAAADPLAARPLQSALAAFEAGEGLDAALIAVTPRADERARVALASLALGVEQRLPRERLADLLAALADRAAFEERLDDEIRARAAGAKQQQRILAALVPGLAIYLAFTMPTLGTTLSTDLGRFVLIPAAAALELLGIVLGRRIVRGALR